MIRSKEDYQYYLEADRISLGIRGSFEEKITHDVWRFERYLRKVEYYRNCKKSVFWRPLIIILNYRFKLLSTRLGFFILPNVFGPGLSIGHPGTLIVNGVAKVGKNCRIHNCVYIATKAGFTDKAPTIGDNVYIGPGAKIFGDITIADGIAIGANAVVNQSFTEPNITIGGVPAKKISNKGSEGLLIKGTQTLDDLTKNRIK
jgi:serine O-acetyltransferase